MLVLIAQVAVSCFLTGLIWLVQVVHYPLMAKVGAERFAEYERLHAAWITPVVGPAMLVEAAIAALLLVHRPASVPAWAVYAGAALVALLWAVTFFVSVPCHAVLAQGFDAAAHQRLVSTNWIRTAAWTARAALAVWMLWLAVAPPRS
jgi:uncharacterized membrane protein